MTLTSQDYAALARDAYRDERVGRHAPGQERPVMINEHPYQVLEHVNNRLNGYQGTIYQRVDTGEIVVAHRGTEQLVRDGLLTDAGMVLTRHNLQANDALELTRRALEYAKKEGRDLGHAPEVTVTGHSLGGTLAQISAHHFNLKGETFNAYGAVSLSYRIPEGGDNLINHVMAADPVSSASQHFGQVRMYATQKEIDTLGNWGFSNSRFRMFIPDSAVGAAAFSLGSHELSNFLGNDSVLNKPEAQELARRNANMISEYRDDVEGLRRGITIGARGITGNLRDLYDHARGPLEAGEPERSDAAREGRASLANPDHVGHPLYNDALRGVHENDARVGRNPDEGSQRLAGTLAAEMHAAGGQRIDQVVMSSDASRSFAVQGQGGDPGHLRVSVDTALAMNTPLEQSSQRVEQLAAQQRQGQAQDAQLEQAQNTARTLQA
ncbi:TPA: DUF2974 domain-containing protein [Stenotrophomonas maltophilia]|nr:DUF2974 domain-containing protein [Stenotrophomonas maltophilia]HDS1042045.1 DUF2974 domain-containing protein [Stenotrophomonas maltophilia]